MGNKADQGKSTTDKAADGRVAAFFAKHSTLFIVIGALTVFATFVVKEVLREQLKDSVDSVTAQESLFIIRSDNSVLAGEIADIKSDFVKPLRKPGATFTKKELIDFDVRYSEPLRARKAAIGASLDNASRLMAILTEVDFTSKMTTVADFLFGDHKASARATMLTTLTSDKHDLEMLQKQFVELNQSLADLDKTLLTDIKLENMHHKIPDADAAPLLSYVDKDLKAFNLSMDVQSFAVKLLNDADRWKAERERSYENAKWFSYGLAAIGWALGLMGSLYGLKGLGSGD